MYETFLISFAEVNSSNTRKRRGGYPIFMFFPEDVRTYSRLRNYYVCLCIVQYSIQCVIIVESSIIPPSHVCDIGDCAEPIQLNLCRIATPM